MPVDRFYLEQSFSQGDMVSLEGDEFHHLSRATRKRAGETLELINGKGQLAVGTLIETKKKSASISIESVTDQEKSHPSVILIQAIPRMNRLDTIIEKATELGAHSIHLFAGDYSERKDLSSSSISRLKKIAESAIKQSGHLYLPEITLYPTLEASLPQEGVLYFGDVDPNAPLLMDVLDRDSSIAMVIGPESGLSQAEEEKLKAKGAIGVKLAAAILRTDTAPIVALGLITHVLCKKQK